MWHLRRKVVVDWLIIRSPDRLIADARSCRPQRTLTPSVVYQLSVPHPLLTSVHCPFNMLWSFKDDVHQSKTDLIILSDTHAFELACMCVVITFVTGKYTGSLRAFSYKASRGLIYLHTCRNLSCSEKWCFRGSQTNACVSDGMMKSVLLRWVPSLNNRSKLKGHCKDVKSGCTTTVGPSLNPHSLSLQKILVLLSL